MVRPIGPSRSNTPLGRQVQPSSPAVVIGSVSHPTPRRMPSTEHGNHIGHPTVYMMTNSRQQSVSPAPRSNSISSAHSVESRYSTPLVAHIAPTKSPLPKSRGVVQAYPVAFQAKPEASSENNVQTDVYQAWQAKKEERKKAQQALLAGTALPLTATLSSSSASSTRLTALPVQTPTLSSSASSSGLRGRSEEVKASLETRQGTAKASTPTTAFQADAVTALQSQQAAVQAKLEALEQEMKAAKVKVEAAEVERANIKMHLAEAQAATAPIMSTLMASMPAPSMSSVQSLSAIDYTIADGEHVIGRRTAEELDHHYDVVVVGGGPVGVAAAMKGAVLGHKCIIVDKPKVSPMPNGLDVSFGGPTGLWSKALRDVSKQVDVPSLQSMHLDDDVIWHQVRNMCVRLAASNASHQVKAIEKFKIHYVQATATVVSAKDVLVDQRQGVEPTIVKTDHVLIATGSKPMRPKDIPFDDCRIFDSDTINSLSYLPTSIAVLGSGIIAIEYAKIFRKLGVKVYMLVRSECATALQRIGLDHDIASKLIEVLHADDVTILEHTTVVSWDVPMSREFGPLRLKLKSKNEEVPHEIEVDTFLAAIGRTPNTSGWGAEKLRLKIAKKGHVEVSDKYETSVADIYAAGDVIGPPSLASTGVYQAQAAMLEMFGQGHMNKFDAYPVGMWTVPECGYYGMTLADADAKGIEVKEGMVHYDACLRGRVFAPVGLLKLVFRVRDGVILGVHILGNDACEMVHYGMDLVTQRVSIFTVLNTCYTAVTFHELFREAALQGNAQLEFGMEWHRIFDEIGEHFDNHEHELDFEKLTVLFHEHDSDRDACVDADQLLSIFHKYGCKIDYKTAVNMVRLAPGGNGWQMHWDYFYKIFDVLEDVRQHSHFNRPTSKKVEGVDNLATVSHSKPESSLTSKEDKAHIDKLAKKITLGQPEATVAGG